MSLEDAAHVILERRIGGLPVLDDGKLVGIITVVDILSAFITIMGMLAYSSRLDVKASSPQTALLEIAQVIGRHDAELISVYHLPKTEGQENVYSVRLKKCDLEPIVADLKKSGMEVVATNLMAP
jgi:acetoin utilization protein AcuB